MSKPNGTILEVRDLCVQFAARGRLGARSAGAVRAVDGVSLTVSTGETLGVVGESGCGKTTLARAILRLIPVASGSIRFDGVDFLSLRGRALRQARRNIQMIFQDPVGSLNPRHTVETIVGEALTVHGVARGKARRERVARLLEQVGLDPHSLARYPHEFSGGQRQRIGIARAFALEPKLIICDEPVSALDVSIQAQIINLLADLRERMGHSYLFIAHNLALVEHFCDRVTVMYLGRMVETASAEEIYRNPRHPYTQALLSAVPEPDPNVRPRGIVLTGEVPSPSSPPSGCAFHPRCPLAMQQCREERPVLRSVSGCASHHRIACHLAEETAQGVSERLART